MRKLIFTVALAASTMIAGAQTLTSKNGTPILPEKGEWSIGFDAVPVINTVGGLFHAPTANGVDYPSNNAMTLIGKMVVDENTAYRAKLGINIGSHTTNANPNATGFDSLTSVSETKVSTMDIAIGAGIQKWRGKGRVRGYYGAEVMIGFGGGTDSTYEYLKPLTTANLGSSQTSEVNGGGSFGLGIDGFIGVEYFFAPKMSLSAEYTWGLAMTSVSESESTTSTVETVNGTDVITTKTTKGGGKASSFNLGVGNTVSPNVLNNSYGSGSIVLSFYF
jgi:hypothetical protein